jgi:hypothetical protein
VVCPWKFRSGANHILIHKKVADSLKRALNAIWTACDHNQSTIARLHYDRFDGSYNFRPIRGGKNLSMHAFAVAIDWDADHNEQGSKTMLFTSSDIIVHAFEAEGWEWGGRWGGKTRDGMHFQAARTK